MLNEQVMRFMIAGYKWSKNIQEIQKRHGHQHTIAGCWQERRLICLRSGKSIRPSRKQKSMSSIPPNKSRFNLKMMPPKTIVPDNRPDCSLSEPLGFLCHCRFYNMGYMIDHDHKPPYCKVEKITIEEEE